MKRALEDFLNGHLKRLLYQWLTIYVTLAKSLLSTSIFLSVRLDKGWTSSVILT